MAGDCGRLQSDLDGTKSVGPSSDWTTADTGPRHHLVPRQLAHFIVVALLFSMKVLIYGVLLNYYDFVTVGPRMKARSILSGMPKK